MGLKNNYSPLRYPGGKAAVADFFAEVMASNGIGADGVYCEPFAGGAGVALTLLLTGKVSRIIINDIDVRIAAFWRSLLENPNKFIGKVTKCTVSINAWKKHRDIYDKATNDDLKDEKSRLRLGFSTFFLNRTNRGGILPLAGPIGGRDQSGKYKIDVRFKKEVLVARLEKIAAIRDRITFSQGDALDFLKGLRELQLPLKRTFMYLDPPYYKRGKELYFNSYQDKDHQGLADYMVNSSNCKWLMTYDDCPEIRRIYAHPQVSIREFYMQYSVQRHKKASEILIVPYNTKLPSLDRQ